MDVESKSNELNQKTHWSQGEFDPFEKSFQEIFLVGPTILSELKKNYDLISAACLDFTPSDNDFLYNNIF